MFKSKNFCHVASNNRNTVKVGVFVYRTTDDLDTVTASGYFNERIIDINLHDLIIHEQIDIADNTKVTRNLLCVTERTLDNVGTTVVKSQWEEDIEEYIDNTFVKKDGSSVMTGPLKFRAGSFVGAIAGGLGDGISIYKLKNDNSIDSEVASLTKTNGFTPGSTNTMDIGRNNLKWKDLYVARVITAVINNGADIAVQAKTGTMALMSDVELAANSGSQLWTTGVWYAKMYAATVPPAAEDGTNYADFSQTDVDNNPIIVIYERQNGAWVQIDTITPPATYNGYLYVTSKIWDITEQAGQQGGQVLWSYSNKTFTPYPRIISFEDIEVTGDSTVVMPASPTQNQIVNKDYVDSNANPLKYASNCITEIPQDINLELNNRTLTLKAGSKVYVPNGFEQDGTTPHFDTVTIANDLTTTGIVGWTGEICAYYNTNGLYCNIWSVVVTKSGSSVPPSFTGIFYNTTTNKISSYYGGSIQEDNMSFPLCVVNQASESTITSIDQVFNGFGYIGSTVFALPGVKGLFCDGRKTDGTLSSVPFEFQNVSTYDGFNNNAVNYLIIKRNFELARSVANGTTYDENTNYIVRSDGLFKEDMIAGVVEASNAGITTFDPKTVFHSLDYNDKSDISGWSFPSQKTLSLTLGASGTTYTAQADGYIALSASFDTNGILYMYRGSNRYGTTFNYNASQWVDSFIPVSKGDIITIQYNGTATVYGFRFIYAKGAL